MSLERDNPLLEQTLAEMERRYPFLPMEGSGFRELIVNGERLGYLNERFYALAQADWTGMCEETGRGLSLKTADWRAAGELLEKTAWGWIERGAYDGWRNERFMCRDGQGRALFALERSAFRPLGLMSRAAHVNGAAIGREASGGRVCKLWIAKRSPDKAVDPNKLDDMVGGGVAFDETPLQAAKREAFEEAGIEPGLLADLREQGLCVSRRPVRHGLHREYMHLHTFFAPPDFKPRNRDGEVAGFRLLGAEEIMRLICDGSFMSDAAMSSLQCLLALGEIPESGLADWLRRRMGMREGD